LLLQAPREPVAREVDKPAAIRGGCVGPQSPAQIALSFELKCEGRRGARGGTIFCGFAGCTGNSEQYNAKFHQRHAQRRRRQSRCHTDVRYLAQAASRFLLPIRVPVRRDLQQEQQRRQR